MQIGDPQIAIGLLLSPRLRQSHTEPTGHVAEGHALTLPDLRNPVKRLGVTRRWPRQSIGILELGTGRVGVFGVGDREGVVTVAGIGIVIIVAAFPVVVHGGHDSFS